MPDRYLCHRIMLAYLIYGSIIFLMKILSGKFVLKSRIPQEPLLCNEFLVPAMPDALFLEMVGA
jgi:hypothetical protein